MNENLNLYEILKECTIGTKLSFPTIAEMDCKYDGFEAGAEWMLEKATAWLVKQGPKANDGVVMICVEDFVKAMKE